MLLAADALNLRLIYHRLAVVQAAAVTRAQHQQARAARYRVTAALLANGWHLSQVVAAIGVSPYAVRYWKNQGKLLELRGLNLPSPSADVTGSGPHRLTASQVADRLSVDVATVRRWIKSGRLPASRAPDSPQGRWLIEDRVLGDLGVAEATITVQEMAQRHGVHPMTVREWIRRGQLPAVAVMPGGALRIPTNAERP